MKFNTINQTKVPTLPQVFLKSDSYIISQDISRKSETDRQTDKVWRTDRQSVEEPKSHRLFFLNVLFTNTL